MTLYHEASEDMLATLLAEGIKCGARGSNGDKATIVETDALLDRHCPPQLRERGVNRTNNIYAYIGTDESLVSIITGAHVKLRDYLLAHPYLLRLTIEDTVCYVSDLNRYDAVRTAVRAHTTTQLESLAAVYWEHVVPLGDYHEGTSIRPEIMITRDIAPQELSLVQP